MKKIMVSVLFLVSIVTNAYAEEYSLVANLSTLERSLKSGSYVVQNGRVVKTDEYSFSYAHISQNVPDHYGVNYYISSTDEVKKTKFPKNMCDVEGQSSHFPAYNLNYASVNVNCGEYVAKIWLSVEPATYNKNVKTATLIAEFYKNDLSQKIPDHIIVTRREVSDTMSDDSGNRSANVTTTGKTSAQSYAANEPLVKNSEDSVYTNHGKAISAKNLETLKEIKEAIYTKDNSAAKVGVYVSSTQVQNDLRLGSYRIMNSGDQHVLIKSQTEIDPTIYKIRKNDRSGYYYNVALHFQKTADSDCKTTSSVDVNELSGHYEFKCGDTHEGTLYIRKNKKDDDKVAILVEIRKTDDQIPTNIFLSFADIINAVKNDREKYKSAIDINDENTMRKN